MSEQQTEQIRAMSNGELSRAIAELLEPLSTFPSDDMQDMEAFPTECWLATFRLSKVTGLHVPEWQPRDIVNDPSMTVMLLEHPGFVQLDKHDDDGLYEVSFCGEDTHSLECGPKIKNAVHVKLGRAVAEAFLLSKGPYGQNK